METFFKTKVWIVGSPRPYDLYYRNSSNAAVPVELQSFRPDPENYLNRNQKYRAVLFFETKHRSLEFLRKVVVSVNGKSFTFYRF